MFSTCPFVRVSVRLFVRRDVCYQTCEHDITTRSSAVAERPRDASCLSVVSFNSTIPRAQSSVIIPPPTVGKGQ